MEVTTIVRCPNKCGWFPKGEGCDKCGYQQKHNKSLRAAKLNSHLYDMAERA